MLSVLSQVWVLAFVTGGASAAIQVGALAATTVVSGYYQRRQLSNRQDSQRGARLRAIGTQGTLPVVYGHARVGGQIVDIREDPSSRNNSIMSVVAALALGSENGEGVDTVQEVYLNEELAITLPVADSDIPTHTRVHDPWREGTSTTFGGDPTDPDADGLWLQYGLHMGSDDQAVDAGMKTRYPLLWKDEHAGRGVCYLALELFYNPEVYRGLPSINALVKGQKVYDPRSSAWAWSDNPALCILDYLTSRRYGYGALYPQRDSFVTAETEIDEQSFIDAANFCEESVTTYDGMTTGNRFRCNGFVDTSRALAQNMAELLTSCMGKLILENGKFRIHINKTQTPVLYVINESNMIGDLEYGRAGADEVHNKVSVTYVDSDEDNQPITLHWPLIDDDNVFLTEDGGVDSLTEFDLPFTVHGYMAQQIAMVRLREKRADMSTQCTLKESGLRLRIGDVVEVPHEEWNLVGTTYTRTAAAAGDTSLEIDGGGDDLFGYIPPMTTFVAGGDKHTVTVGGEITNHQLTISFTPELSASVAADTLIRFSSPLFWVDATAAHPNGTVQVALSQYDARAYDLDEVTALPSIPNTNLPNPNTVAAPTNFVLVSDANTQVAGIPGILATWDAAAEPFLRNYRIEYKLMSEDASAWRNAPRASRMVTRQTISPVVNAEEYQVRIASVNVRGFTSDYESASVMTTTVPAALGRPVPDIDGDKLYLFPGFSSGLSYKYLVVTDTTADEPTAAEVRATSTVVTSTGATLIHTFTTQGESVRVGVLYYTNAAGDEGEGGIITLGPIFYRPAAVGDPPLLTWSPAVPQGTSPSSKEAVLLVATDVSRDVALYYRDYNEGANAGAYTRNPVGTTYTDDPLQQRVEVTRPAEGGTNRLIEAYAEADDGTESTPIVIVVDGDITPTITATLNVDAMGQSRVTVRSRDADTGSYRLRWAIGAATADIAALPAFSDASNSQEMSGSRSGGGVNSGGQMGEEFEVGDPLESTQKIVVTLHGLRTSSTSGTNQAASKRSEAYELSHVANQVGVLGTFHMDRDDLDVNLTPVFVAARSYKWAVTTTGTAPTETVVKAGTVATSADTVYTLTAGTAADLYVGVVFYTNDDGTGTAGPLITRPFNYDPSAEIEPLLTWRPKLPAGATATSKEAVYLVATHPTEDVAIEHRNYLAGASPPSFTRAPVGSSVYEEDPYEIDVEVNRPNEGTTARWIEARALGADGTVSGSTIIVVDGAAEPSLTAALVVDPTTGQPRITVRSADADTGSYRGRWAIGAADANIAVEPVFDDDSDSQEFSGSRTVGGANSGRSFGTGFAIGDILKEGEKIDVVLFALRTTGTGGSAQSTSRRSGPLRTVQCGTESLGARRSGCGHRTPRLPSVRQHRHQRGGYASLQRHQPAAAVGTRGAFDPHAVFRGR